MAQEYDLEHARAAAAAAALGAAEDLQRLPAHDGAVAVGLGEVVGRDVRVTGVGCVGLAMRRQALRDADARAIELPDNPLLLLGWGASGGRQDEVCGPPQREWLASKTEGRHDLRDVAFQEIRGQILEYDLLRPVISIYATAGRLLVYDAHQRVADAIVAKLALHDARAKPLVHELAACGFA
eukprot:CAMPEP_0198610870 /NCGR_PEP_ID=MMETSP1462-20131121/157112_1 /TAXON_ID=1333877 /ORGANISM="Brandtodinium nutriculum, Strain RCC3387" /LENGTH=181 /DNA_ID=CAMNT_0044342675 /DNA_START=75 /DNA_END=616 /DNA_ORIENTATION=+